MSVTTQVDLTHRTCQNCGKEAKEVIGVQDQVRQGWYCIPCLHMEPAIGRERKLV
jgi:hypothetical protein